MPPQVVDARVTESRSIEPDLHWLRLDLPEIGGTWRPGQYVTVLQPERLDPYLPTPLHPTHIASDGIGCLFRLGEREGWLRDVRAGSLLQVRGPLGQPFLLNQQTRNLLLVGEGMAALPLLPLANEANTRGMEASFLAWHPLSRSGLLPPGLLPSAVEYRSAVGTEALAGALGDTVGWAGQVCAAGSRETYDILWQQIQRIRLRYVEGFCQVFVFEHVLCGMGACGQCLTRLKRKHVHPCVDGPVFDLREVI